LKMASGISGLGIAVVLGGGILVWSGLKGYTVTATAHSIISGQQPVSLPNVNPVRIGGLIPGSGLLGKALGTSSSGTGSGSGTTPPKVTGHPIQIADKVLPTYGWSNQLQDLINLWNRESGWNPRIANSSSGALGIAQALGHGNAQTGGTLGNEYGGFGLTNAQAKAANSGDAYWQIIWGLNYIRATYGSITAAWQHEQSAGWY
jgi:hypothetical protein